MPYFQFNNNTLDRYIFKITRTMHVSCAMCDDEDDDMINCMQWKKLNKRQSLILFYFIFYLFLLTIKKNCTFLAEIFNQ